MAQHVKQWIPVASHSVIPAPNSDIVKLKGWIPILAIYGDLDSKGKVCSNKLQDLAEAQVLELPGRHPCYLDSPKEFVDAVVKFVESSS